MTLLRAGVVLVVLTANACTCAGPRLSQVTDEPRDAGPECAPLAEVCNGRDDDCDGEVDEGLGVVSCGVGACHVELEACVGGQGSQCMPGAPTAEQCNGRDDDCDGEVDEGLMPTMCGVGECAAVSATCIGGMPMACQPGPAHAEQCNGLDDDCNGTVDEGLVSNTSGDLRVTQESSSSDFVYLAGFDGGFGVVWQDKRDGAAQKGEIYFASLGPTGTRLAPTDRRLTTTAGMSTHPAMAWNGAQWALVYADDTTGDLELYARALDADGTPRGAAVRLTNAALDSDWPDVVWAGTSFAVAWEDERAGANKQDIYFRRFDARGQPVGSEVRVTTDPARQTAPILKWNGSTFAVVWMDNRHGTGREIYFRRLDAQGQPLGAEVRVTNDTADSAWPDLSWNAVDREWALVWHDSKDGNQEIYFARLTVEGQRIGGDVRLTNAAGASTYPSIDFNGFQYGVSWQDDRGTGKAAIYYAPVSARGVKTAPEFKLSVGSGVSSFTTALWNGSTFAFGWRDDRDGPTGNTEIYFANVGCPRTQ